MSHKCVYVYFECAILFGESRVVFLSVHWNLHSSEKKVVKILVQLTSTYSTHPLTWIPSSMLLYPRYLLALSQHSHTHTTCNRLLIYIFFFSLSWDTPISKFTVWQGFFFKKWYIFYLSPLKIHYNHFYIDKFMLTWIILEESVDVIWSKVILDVEEHQRFVQIITRWNNLFLEVWEEILELLVICCT